MEGKIAEFLNHYNLCRKYKLQVQDLMTQDHTKLMMAGHNHVIECLKDKEYKDIIEKLKHDFKMSESSVKETMMFGKFLEKFIELKKLKEEDEDDISKSN